MSNNENCSKKYRPKNHSAVLIGLNVFFPECFFVFIFLGFFVIFCLHQPKKRKFALIWICLLNWRNCWNLKQTCLCYGSPFFLHLKKKNKNWSLYICFYTTTKCVLHFIFSYKKAINDNNGTITTRYIMKFHSSPFLSSSFTMKVFNIFYQLILV